MSKKKIALIISLALSMSLSACGNDTYKSSDDNSVTERIEELEATNEELEAENKELRAQLKNQDSSESNQQADGVEESLVKATVGAPEKSGICGADLIWYYQNGVLVITGTGEMTDYTKAERPWNELELDWIIIEDGVTTIGENAFRSSSSLSKVVFPATLEKIGDGAFVCCENISKIIFKGNLPDGMDMIWQFRDAFESPAYDGEQTEEEKLRARGEWRLIPMTIYYSGNTFDEFINSYPYWSDYGVEWIRQ